MSTSIPEDATELMNFQIKIVETVKQKAPRSISYKKLYKKLTKHYNRDSRLGITSLEYFNSTDYVKPHFDYEQYLQKFDHLRVEECKNNFLKVANEILNVSDEDWAISDDSRLVYKKGKNKKEYTEYKISFHFVLNRKCIFEQFGYFVKEKLNIFLEQNITGIDEKIYRIGINKFRLPMTKKSSQDIESLLTPRNYTKINEFHRHIVQITSQDDCIELKIKLSKSLISYKTISQKIEQKATQFDLNSKNEIEDILKDYTVISTKDGTNDYDGCIFYDILEKECGKDHKNNHNYLIHNTIENRLKIKCHSSKCEDFQKVLYEQPSPTLHFDMNYLLNIPIPSNSTNNYQHIKKYFQQFFIFIRDTNSYYRKSFEYNQKYRFYEQEIKPINIYGYTKDFFYKELIDDDDDDKNEKNNNNNNYKLKKFYKKYESDPYKKSYFGLCFQPYGVHEKNHHFINNGDYNLFCGFHYKHVITYKEKQQISSDIHHENNLKFLLNHIKQYICGGISNDKTANHSFNYLMYFLANIIQYPTIVPHIIMIFYSRTHGTGKSGFTKFLANVIGPSLCYFGSYEQIMEKHTNAHVGKLINVVEEIDRYNSKKFHNQMKDFSQRDRAVYNEKNKPQYNIKTFVRYFKTTNYQDGVWFDAEDRRYIVYTFKKIYNDDQYVKKLCNILEDPSVVYLFGKYLENIKIPYKGLDEWQKNRPLTDDYYTMRSEDPITQFLKDFIKLESINISGVLADEYFIAPQELGKNTVVIAKEAFYRLFVSFYDDNNCLNRKYKAKLQFMKHISVNYKNQILIRKYTERFKSRKNYYVIILDKLWETLFEKTDKFVNYHQ